MDHLPRVESPFHRDLVIPIFVKEGHEYAGNTLENFLTFPTQLGFDLGKLKFGDFGEKTFQDALSFLQAWGYFGMVTETFRLCGFGVAFVLPHGETDGNYIKKLSEMLPDLLRIWFDREQVLDPATKDERADKIRQVLVTVRRVLADIIEQEFKGTKVSSSEKILEEDEAVLSEIVQEVRDGGHVHKFGTIITDKYFEWNRNFFTDEKGWEEEKMMLAGTDWNLGRFGSKAHQMMLSIITVGETLTNAASTIYGSFERFSWPRMAFVTVIMQIGGWCPYQISQVQGKCTTSRLWDLSFLDRRPYTKSHANCCNDYCVAYYVDEETYNTCHVKDGCVCPYITFEDQLAAKAYDWLQDGHTPLVHRRVSDINDRPEWELIRSHSDGKVARYVAISHVWTDGRGNPKQNSILQCQLEEIQRAVNELYKPASQESEADKGESDVSKENVPFWIDTICVPLQQPMRGSSIDIMARIYQEAERVLVFDKTITDANVEATIEESMTIIEMSGWMQRLWTLQEGVLASNLYFQFRQHATTIEKLQMDYRLKCVMADLEKFQLIVEDMENPMRGVLGRQLQEIGDFSSISNAESANLEFNEIYYSSSFKLGSFGLLRNMPQENMTKDFWFCWMLDLLYSRGTSKIEDEPMCIATILRIDTKALREVPLEDRMKSILMNYKDIIPSGIIFGKGPRVKKRGSRWVPSSFMCPDFNWSGKTEQITDWGLMASYPSLIFRPNDANMLNEHFGLVDCSTGIRYLVDIFNVPMGMCISLNITWHIVLEVPLGKNERIKGIMVFVAKEEDDCYYAEYVAPVLFRNLGERKPLPDNECIFADPLVPDHMWCIG